MADFTQAFDRLMNEEGIVLTNNKSDRGGLTYAGISRKYHPEWSGWNFIDRGETPPTSLVRSFYLTEYWEPIRGDSIMRQEAAEALFSTYVNMGEPAIKMAQVAVGVLADGKLGPKSLMAINAMDAERFQNRFCIAMVARYHAIGMRDKTQRVWWPGWIARALKVAA